MGPSPTIHADADTGLRQAAGKREAGELDPLIRVEDRRPADPQGVVQAVEAEPGLQGVGQSPGQHLAAIPVQDRRQIHKPAEQPDVGNVGTPHVIRAGHRHAAQQVRVDPVIGVGMRQHRFRVDRRQPHLPHQAHHALAIHRMARPAQHRRHPPAAVERMGRVLLVQPAHQRQVQGVRFGGPVVPRAPIQSEQRALGGQR